uniref:Uncharacterized protein n=1 Tax=Haptolina brevifila TaxID=156173 RepID=A0A7S2IH40_9EUKA
MGGDSSRASEATARLAMSASMDVCYSIAHRRARRALPLFKEECGDDVQDDTAVEAGLTALGERYSRERRTHLTLLKRALHEVAKAEYALPSLKAPHRISLLAQHGFDHSATIVAALRAALGKRGEEDLLRRAGPGLVRHIRSAFREAVRQKKRDGNIQLDRYCVGLLKAAKSAL